MPLNNRTLSSIAVHSERILYNKEPQINTQISLNIILTKEIRRAHTHDHAYIKFKTRLN